ncbi:MAG: histidine kinase, partial [Planctomycetota bacterium]|nr:histidine kinase [Planctomycetota bacterium]
MAQVEALVGGKDEVAACLAPSFPAEFAEVEWRQVVGMLRALGFRYVHEVAFGADLVAQRYRRLLAEGGERRYIATTCPAAVTYIEKYCPDLIPFLAPIASPMIALARYLRRRLPDLRIVFIGPCIAKKAEAAGLIGGKPREVDAVLTFAELRRWCEQRGLVAEEMPPADFDPPHAAEGRLFPVSRGLLQAAEIQEDILAGEVLTADGRANFVEAIRAFHAGELAARLLEILCCEGCIMGPGFSATSRLFAPAIFSRRSRVSQYARERLQRQPRSPWERAIREAEELDLSQDFQADDQRIPQPPEKALRDILARMGKHRAEDELNCGACGYDTCLEHAIAIYNGLAENEMCLPHTIEELRLSLIH